MANLLREPIVGDLKIFNKEFKDFLPEKIIDFHVHLCKKIFIEGIISEDRAKSSPSLDPDIVNGFTVEDFKNVTQKIFPGKRINGLFFGYPIKEVNLDKSNKYISDVCKENNSHGLFIPEPDLKVIPENFFKNKFIGFKPYPELVNFKVTKDFSKQDINISIFDFISKKVLEFSQKHGLIITIHIPRKNRLNDIRNIEEIKKINNEYPDIKIVLAHAGRSYCYNNIRDAINDLKDIGNLYVDTAMINDFRVNEVLIKKLGVRRILYGSDLPIAAFKGKNIDINDKHYFVTSRPKGWSLSSSKMRLDNFTFFNYEIIRAIKIAASNLSLKRKDIENIFHDNALRLINDVVKNIT